MVAVSASTASAQINCGDTIVADVTLTGDLDCSGFSASNNVVIFGADDITFDGDGFSVIWPTNTPQARTIFVMNGRSNVTLQNVVVPGRGVGWGTTVYLNNTTNATIDNVFSNNVNTVVNADGTNDGLTIRNSDFSGSTYGVNALGLDSDFVLEGNDFENAGTLGGSGLYISGNTGAFTIDAADNNNFVNSGIRTCCPWAYGITLSNTTGITLDGLDLSANNNGGAIVLQTTTDTVLRNITANNRVWGVTGGTNGGLVVEDSSFNNVSNGAFSLGAVDPGTVMDNVSITNSGRWGVYFTSMSGSGTFDASGLHIDNWSTLGAGFGALEVLGATDVVVSGFSISGDDIGLRISGSNVDVTGMQACNMGRALWVASSTGSDIDGDFANSTTAIRLEAASTGAVIIANFGNNTTDVDDQAGDASVTSGTIPDSDNDGVNDACDDCIGDDTSGNDDGDDYCNDSDNCADDPNNDQDDSDNDGNGDACDLCVGDDTSGNSDGDLYCDANDNCPDDPNDSQADQDQDGIGNACDLFPDSPDFDNDGVENYDDNCPFDANASQDDGDNDGIGDACDNVDDLDIDGDGDLNVDDNCPFEPNDDQADTDGDGVGDVCDTTDGLDVDGDGDLNADDNCPFVANDDQADADGDGVGDMCDSIDDDDYDGDGVDNVDDNCAFDANADQADEDNDGMGDACDPLVLIDDCNASGAGPSSSWLLIALAFGLTLVRRRRRRDGVE